MTKMSKIAILHFLHVLTFFALFWKSGKVGFFRSAPEFHQFFAILAEILDSISFATCFSTKGVSLMDRRKKWLKCWKWRKTEKRHFSHFWWFWRKSRFCEKTEKSAILNTGIRYHFYRIFKKWKNPILTKKCKNRKNDENALFWNFGKVFWKPEPVLKKCHFTHWNTLWKNAFLRQCTPVLKTRFLVPSRTGKVPFCAKSRFSSFLTFSTFSQKCIFLRLLTGV